VKVSQVISAENILIEIALRVHVVVRRISLNISGFTGLIFAIFSPYKRALCASDRSEPRFLICQGRLPCQPNNIAEYCRNEGKLIHAFFARSPVGARFRFATTCY